MGFYFLQGGEIPYVEMFGTFALSVGAAVNINPFFNGIEIGVY